MNSSQNKIIPVLLFGIAMGYLEAAVVVYLRALYFPMGFAFPLKEMAQDLVVTELLREAATLVMLVTIGLLAAKERLHRFAWFLFVFAIWDIAYYVFLKLLIDWPGTFLTDDILFLLPSLWTGPVIAPIINSVTMILLAAVILSERQGSLPLTRLSRPEMMLLLSGALIVLVAYMEEYARYAWAYKQSLPQGQISWKELMIILPSHFVPQHFDWLMYWAGVLLILLAILLIYNRSSHK